MEGASEYCVVCVRCLMQDCRRVYEALCVCKGERKPDTGKLDS